MEDWFLAELEKIEFKVEQGVLAGWHLSVTAAQDIGSDLKKLIDHNKGTTPLKPGSITPHPVHAQQMAEAKANKPQAEHPSIGKPTPAAAPASAPASAPAATENPASAAPAAAPQPAVAPKQ